MDHDPMSEADEALFLQWKENKCTHITNTSNITCFFMHKHDDELFYAIKHESKHVTKTLPHMPFTGTEFSPVFEAYHDFLLDTMWHAVLKDHFDWLHCDGLEKMQPAQVSPPSPQKQCNKILIPSTNDIATYESCPANSQPFGMPTDSGSTVGMSSSLASTLNMGAMQGASFPPYEHFLTNPHPHRPINSGTTSTAGASGSITGNQPSSSMDWSMEFWAFGPIYYDYDL
ncbi:hypothetical protein BKA83DRAFT_4501519 [Pisolithus microcarpus]|nr:hypothetical protein BKA83DRAFT_4501519 [Pisolithus microcarpus]